MTHRAGEHSGTAPQKKGFNLGGISGHLSFLGSTAQLRPWLPPQNPAEFLGGFSTIFFFTG
jgi:hypothetical protein